MCSMDSQWLLTKTKDEYVPNPLQWSMSDTTDRVRKVTAETDERAVRLNAYKVSGRDQRRKASSQDFNIKAMTSL